MENKDQNLTNITALQERIAQLEATIKTKDSQIKKLEDENKALKAELAKRFRKASEKIQKEGGNPVNESEENVSEETLNYEPTDTSESDKENDSDRKNPLSKNKKRAYIKHKTNSAKFALPPDTPITVIHIDDEAPVCSKCNTTKVKVGERAYDSIVKTVSYAIIRRIKNVYACPTCEEDNSNSKTVPTGNVLETTVIDPLFLADVLNSKFNMGVPLYRQERLFKEQGLDISRFLLSASIMRAGNQIIDNLAPLLEEELFKMPLINADETPMKVIQLEDGKGKKKAPNSRFNSFIIGRIGVDKDGKPGLTSFTFSSDRKNATMAELFNDYHGCVQTDGLSGYSFAEEQGTFTHLGCLVHARRHAIEAMGSRTSGIAYDMVQRYAAIFHAESQMKDLKASLTDEEFISQRKAAMLPLFEDMKNWLNDTFAKAEQSEEYIAPSTSSAMKYFLSRYDELVRFLDYSFSTSSNQIAEISIRKWIIDRNNFLFCFTETGADVSAFFFSLIVSCRNLGINPTDYLAHLFLNANKLSNNDIEGWRALLPGKCDLDDVIKLKQSVAAAKPDLTRTEEYILRGKRL